MTAEKNRLAAAKATKTTLPLVIDDIQASIGQLEERIERLEASAVALIRADPSLSEDYDRINTAPGIARCTAVRILGKVACLPSDMEIRQVVAHAGLDVCQFRSGTSVHRKSRISKAGNKRLRTALYMPAITAVRCDANVRAFHDRLSERQVGLQPTAAVMRKMLVALVAMLRNRTLWDSARFNGAPKSKAAA